MSELFRILSLLEARKSGTHSLVFGCFEIAVPRTDPTLIERRNFKNYREDLLRRDLFDALNKYDWQSDDPNKLWDIFKSIFTFRDARSFKNEQGEKGICSVDDFKYKMGDEASSLFKKEGCCL